MASALAHGTSEIKTSEVLLNTFLHDLLLLLVSLAEDAVEAVHDLAEDAAVTIVLAGANLNQQLKA